MEHLPPKKRNHQEVVSTEIQQLTRKLSVPAVAVGHTLADSYSLGNYSMAKEDKIVVECKIICIEKQMDSQNM